MLDRFRRRTKTKKADELDELRAELRRERERAHGREEALSGELAALRASMAAVPGLPGGDTPSAVTVGGVAVTIRPLPPVEWLEALGELPGFLYAHARASVGGEDVDPSELAGMVASVRRWLRACLRPEDLERVDLEELTLPEAAHGLGVMARKNGLDENLAAFFRERGVASIGRPDVPEVRDTPERAPS